MVVSGIIFRGNKLRIVTLSGTRKKHSLIATKFHKLELPKYPTQDDVNYFKQAFIAYCNDNRVDKVLLNKRNLSGEHAGGAASFRAEGILLAIAPCEVGFVHSATVAATDRKIGNLKRNRPTTEELGRAYDIAFEGME